MKLECQEIPKIKFQVLIKSNNFIDGIGAAIKWNDDNTKQSPVAIKIAGSLLIFISPFYSLTDTLNA
jgi:hypothetical protein